MTRNSPLKIATIAAVALSSFFSAVHAQTTYVWDPSNTGSGPSSPSGVANGTWNTSAKEWANGGTDLIWPNTTTTIAQFGTSNGDTTKGNIVTLAGTVSAAGLNFSIGNGTGGYSLTGTAGQTGIIGPSGGTFTITSTGLANPNPITNIAFTGASTYQFLGQLDTVGVAAGYGNTLFAGTSFAGNVIFGNGSDNGTMAFSSAGTTANITSGTVTENNGWTLNVVGAGKVYNQAITLNGFGQSGHGALYLSGTSSTADTYNGAITLGSDVAITAAGTQLTDAVTGAIGGNANLFLVDVSAGSTVEKLIIGGSNATNTYTGQTVIVENDGGTATNVAAVRLGQTNALPTGTTVVLGESHAVNTVTGAGTILSADAQVVLGGPSGTTSNGAWTNSDGALDMNGYSQTVAGLAVGGTQLASNQYIFNNASGTISTLAVTGTGTPSSGFAGVIKDNTSGTGTVALGVTGGALNLTGVGNTYSGGTAVTGGILSVNNAAGSSATGTGAVNVSGSGTLGGGSTTTALSPTTGGATYQTFSNSGAGAQGFITGAVTIGAGGTWAPGNNSVGTITMAQLTLQSGSFANYEFDSTVGSGVNDFTIVTGGLTLNGGTFNLYAVGTTNPFAAAGTYNLIGYGTDSGSTNNLSVGDQQAGYTYTFNDDTTDHVIQLTIGVTPTPEPSTWAMLFAGAAVLGIYLRRRSAKNS